MLVAGSSSEEHQREAVPPSGRFLNAIRRRPRTTIPGHTQLVPGFQTSAIVETLEPRVLLVSDFGDAPDTGAGTGTGDYQTLNSDNGPSHTIVAGLFMGAGVDDETDAFPNIAANGDDVDQALPDDEDGLTNPAVDLVLTAGRSADDERDRHQHDGIVGDALRLESMPTPTASSTTAPNARKWRSPTEPSVVW